MHLVRGFQLAMGQAESPDSAEPYLFRKRCYETWLTLSVPRFSACDLLMEVRRPTRTRAEIVVHKPPSSPLGSQHVFVVVFREGQWWIDAVKERVLLVEDRYRNLLRTRPPQRADGLAVLDAAFGTLERRRLLARANEDAEELLQALEDPAPCLERLLALTDHPDLVNNSLVGRHLLWQGWRRFQNQACIDRLAYFGDAAVIDPVVELLLDPVTSIRRRVFLANMADGLDDHRVIQAIRTATERGLLDRKAAVRTLVHLGAHDDAEALAVREQSTRDTEADSLEE